MSDSLKIPEGGDFAIQGAFCVPEEEITIMSIMPSCKSVPIDIHPLFPYGVFDFFWALTY